MIKQDICSIKGIQCKNLYSCKMLMDRFGVRECENGAKFKIEKARKEELKERKKIVKFVSHEKFKFVPAWQINKAYRSYKQAVIDKQAENKKKC